MNSFLCKLFVIFVCARLLPKLPSRWLILMDHLTAEKPNLQIFSKASSFCNKKYKLIWLDALNYSSFKNKSKIYKLRFYGKTPFLLFCSLLDQEQFSAHLGPILSNLLNLWNTGRNCLLKTADGNIFTGKFTDKNKMHTIICNLRA